MGRKVGRKSKKDIGPDEKDPYISKKELSLKVGISSTAIDKNIILLKRKGLLQRIGTDRGGHWEVVVNDENEPDNPRQ